MKKKYLRSDMSKAEAEFFTTGHLIIGTGNVLTGLIKYIGMYSELQETNRTSEIILYNPDNDHFFKRENAGYTTLRRKIAQSHTPVSRKYIKYLSRKWGASYVVISFDAIHIISELFAYISDRADLKAACMSYLKDYNLQVDWDKIMPIQFQFLGARINDKHDNWQIAEQIVTDLATIVSGGKL